MKKLFYILCVAVGLLSTPNLAEAGVVNKCAALFSFEPQREFVSNERADELTETVQFVWYPKSEYVMISHVELSVDGRMWDATAGLKENGTIEGRERAARSGDKGYFSFSLRITPDEKAQIQKYIEENSGKVQAQMCVSGACKVLRKNTGISIPFPFSQVPTLSAIYLSLGKLMRSKHIERIDYVGKSRLLNLLSPALIGEGAITYQVGTLGFGMIVWFTNEAGELVRQVIPIILGKAENKQNDMTSVA